MCLPSCINSEEILLGLEGADVGKLPSGYLLVGLSRPHDQISILDLQQAGPTVGEH